MMLEYFRGAPFATFLLDHANQWSLVFIILSFEILFCTLIVLPIPLNWRQTILLKTSNLWNRYPRLRIVMKTVMGIITILFVDASLTLYTVHVRSNTPAQPGTVLDEKEINLTLFEAQRNAFLCGFSVFLFLMLYRFQSMADRITSLQEQINEVSSRKTEHGLKKRVWNNK